MNTLVKEQEDCSDKCLEGQKKLAYKVIIKNGKPQLVMIIRN